MCNKFSALQRYQIEALHKMGNSQTAIATQWLVNDGNNSRDIKQNNLLIKIN